MSSNKLANVTSLLTEDEKLMIAHIYEPVANYQSYVKKTSFPVTIMNKITEPYVTRSDIEVFLAQLISNANGSRSLKQLQSSFENFTNVETIPSRNTTLETLLFTDPNSFTDKVVDKFKTIIAPIGPSFTIPREYTDSLLAICSHSYYTIYQQLYKTLQNTGSSYSNSFPYMSISSIESICANLTRAIKNNVTFYPGVDTADDYINKCYQSIYDVTVNEYINDQINCELFAVAFLPYFTFIYLMNFIATPVIESTNKAPRNGIIRRIAIQAIYEEILYMIYGTYLISAKYSPNSEQTYELRMLLDTAVTQIFDKEASITDSEESYVKMHQDTKRIFDMNEKLRSISDDIESSRNTLSGVMANSSSLDSQIKTSSIVYWSWVVIMLLFSAYFLFVVLFMRNRLYHDAYLISAIILLIIITILGIVKLSRS